MVIYVPVKFEFDWTNHFRVRVRKRKSGRTEKRKKNGQMDRQTNTQNYTNFKRNLAMMVSYVPVKYEFDWTNCFRVRVQKRKCRRKVRWTDKRTKKRTNEQTQFHRFQQKPRYDGDLSFCQIEFDQRNHFRVRVRKQKNVDGQTDGRRTHQSNRQAGYTQPA